MSPNGSSARLLALALLCGGLAACGEYHPEWHHNTEAASTGSAIGGVDSGDTVVKGLSSPSLQARTGAIGGTR
ncbi:hypothetical protein FHR90_002584 [Endobacter medicaginis]|uniref:Lipoprotein n=1 Tax=Endobacter medicaginis TaxID=1181271 RepID=A0A850NLE0_9PROT|nr:hypothetical protein [Endobacter medicaginis]MBB3174738.1 hypothetical protein [Endobacter medicaginis]MCX5474867.1 hypothetical protein [Endobacter medicaginis]NVN30621.1 hypothetical protein [Endobacter medicaginis]